MRESNRRGKKWIKGEKRKQRREKIEVRKKMLAGKRVRFEGEERVREGEKGGLK